MKNHSSHKDPAIIHVVTELRRAYGLNALATTDPWRDEVDAIGLSPTHDPSLMAYVAIFPDGYYLDLERAAEPGSDVPYAEAGSYRPLTAEQVIAIVKKHFAFKES